MPDVFDLTKVKKLVEDRHLTLIIVVDTNILIKEPDYTSWKIPATEPLYILSSISMLELGIKQKQEEKKSQEKKQQLEESFEAAAKARKGLATLISKGRIAEGIHVEGVGWFISVPTPRKQDLAPELDELEEIKAALGEPDTKLLLLTKECSQFVPRTTTVLATADVSLFNITSGNGLPSYLFKGFPLVDMHEVVNRYASRSVADWDKELRDAQNDIRARSVKMWLTLTSQKCAPKSLRDLADWKFGQLIVAEGYGGIVSRGADEVLFVWSLLFSPWEHRKGKPRHSVIVMDPRIDFLGTGKSLPIGLRKTIEEKIFRCASPSAFLYDMPTVQDLRTVMMQVLYLDYVKAMREKESIDEEDELPDETLKRFYERINSEEDLKQFCIEWICERSWDEDELTFAFVETFVKAIASCWKLGVTYTFTLLCNQEEPE